MARIMKHGLLKIGCLTDDERADVEALAALCREFEGLELPLFLDAPQTAGENDTHQLLFYASGTLIGFADLFVFVESEIELLGMVHPDHRRNGIGRLLLEATMAECRRRGMDSFLLVAEETSESGRAFAQAVGARYCFSEYRMSFDPTAIAAINALPQEAIELQRAGVEDRKTVLRLLSAIFGHPMEKCRLQVERWLCEPGQQIYIGSRNGEAIGMIRTAPDGAGASLNSFGVLPEYRGHGYGRQILSGVIHRLLPENQGILLEVATDNRTALSLYHSCGFRETASFGYYRVQG